LLHTEVVDDILLNQASHSMLHKESSVPVNLNLTLAKQFPLELDALFFLSVSVNALPYKLIPSAKDMEFS